MNKKSGHERTIEQLREEISYVIRLLRFSYEAIISIDESHNIIIFNEGAERIFGYAADELRGRSVHLLLPEHLREAHRRDITEFGRSADNAHLMHVRRPLVGLRKSGENFPAQASVYKLSYGSKTIFTTILRDLTAESEAIQRLMYLAEHDFLTGLPNRLLFMDRLTMAIARADRERAKIALLYMDVDAFKTINDALGHSAGDLLLKMIAERVHSCMRETDTVARIGGDEFAVIAEGLHQENDAEKVKNTILNEIEKPFDLEGKKITASLSIGIALCPDHGQDPDSLIQHADSAMYVAKQKRGISKTE